MVYSGTYYFNFMAFSSNATRSYKNAVWIEHNGKVLEKYLDLVGYEEQAIKMTAFVGCQVGDTIEVKVILGVSPPIHFIGFLL